MKNYLLLALFFEVFFFDSYYCLSLVNNGFAFHHRRSYRHFLTSQLFSSLSKTPLTYFNDFQEERIEAANRIPFDYEALVKDESSSSLPQVVSFQEFQRLLRDGTSNERKEFFEQFQYNGGCFLLDLDDEAAEEYRHIIQSMWWTMNEFFTSANYKSVPELHQQYLPKNDNEKSDEEEIGGYDFIQTYQLEDTQILPAAIQKYLGNITESWYGVDGSFQALASIGKMAAELLVTGALGEDKLVINNAMADLIGAFSNCNHRLCCYLPVEEDIETTSLRSHTDWSLLTLTPVSSIPGLMVFRESTKEWMMPETIVSRGKSHDQYLLVMAGKNLDLLTGTNTGLACIHQVITTTTLNQKQQRLSAPFFLRPKVDISNDINEKFNSEELQEHFFSKESVISRIHKCVFQNVIQNAREERNDPLL